VIRVVIPSRGRPERARIAVQAVRDTAVLVDTSVILAVDADDPALPLYQALRFDGFAAEVSIVTLRPEDTGDLVRATNTVSMRIARAEPTSIIGNLGDDHLCRTDAWDRRITEVLATPAIAYGDDLIQGEHLPTAPFVSAEIVNALGWFFLPTVKHLYGDDCLKRIGRATGTLRYVPDVVIEHVHPAVGKAAWDAGYERANNARASAVDLRAYITWLHGRTYNKDIANVERVSRVGA
jgi:hypothetical protein